MKVDTKTLARRLGLAAGSSEAEIRAALYAPISKAKAAPRTVAPTRARLTEASVRAMSPAELEAGRHNDALGSVERQLLVDELEHRAFVARNFPATARAAGYPQIRHDLSARSGSAVRGIGE